jgi:hypothetical protein
MIIDFSSDAVLIGLVAVGLLVVAIVAIGAAADRREREAMRVLAARVGAWWANRNSSGATVYQRAVNDSAEKRRAA